MPVRSYDDAIGPLRPAQTPELDRFRKAVKADIEADYARSFGIADAVAGQRAARQLSQSELAALSGVTQAEISRLESGKGNQTLQTISKILTALDLTLEVIGAHAAKDTAAVPGPREESGQPSAQAQI